MEYLDQIRAYAEGLDPAVVYDDAQLESLSCVYFTFSTTTDALIFTEQVNLFANLWRAKRIEIVVQVKRNS